MGAGFNPELSGTDNILLNGAMLGFSRREMQAKVDGIYEFTGLREFADLPLKYYSSGMYMRLAFAIATEIDPDILLIDESLGVGRRRVPRQGEGADPRTCSTARTSSSSSRTTWTRCARLCTRGVWMQQGAGRRRRPDRRGRSTRYLRRRRRLAGGGMRCRPSHRDTPDRDRGRP